MIVALYTHLDLHGCVSTGVREPYLQRWNDLDLFRFRRKMLENKAIREAIDEELGRAGVAIFAKRFAVVEWLHDDY